MNSSLILSNLLNPPVLFFFAGILAVLFKSDLDIPQPLPKLFSLYLLMVIGFKGGHEIAESGLDGQVAVTLLAAILMASIVPIYSFFILRTKLDAYNAGAIAATYGSISAVTFVTASSFLDQLDIPSSGHMVAALALMESPAIIVGLILIRLFTNRKASELPRHEFAQKTDQVLNSDVENSVQSGPPAIAQVGTRPKKEGGFSWSEVLREAFLNGSVFLLFSSLTIGVVTGVQGWEKLKPFIENEFYGVLCFFLLDMGIVACTRIRELAKAGSFVIGFSVFMPIFNAMIGILLAKLIGMSVGNALLFAVLCASASYIAVPAAMRMSVPQANPSLYVSMALALTFPFNIIIGIPIYLNIIQRLWST
jgi:uncharacterized protein